MTEEEEAVHSNRKIGDKIILSTLPHYVAMGFVICANPIYIVYAFIIFTSATLSVVWHASGEHPGKLM